MARLRRLAVGHATRSHKPGNWQDASSTPDGHSTNKQETGKMPVPRLMPIPRQDAYSTGATQGRFTRHEARTYCVLSSIRRNYIALSFINSET
ncbi:MAG: hypothetical protein F6K26_19320 [Moorea sp. SIO2I5]|nr:hypothetical protein [Moorena sp. SIO2I5]